MLRWIVRIRHRSGARTILRFPLMGTRRAFRQFPIVAKQVFEEVVVPLRRRRGPNYLKTAADRVCPFARTKFALPAEALLLDAGRLRLGTHERRITGTVGFAQGVSAGN